jgi:hypothetical protein
MKTSLCVLIRRTSLDNPLWRATQGCRTSRNPARLQRAAAEQHGKIRVGTLMPPEDYCYPAPLSCGAFRVATGARHAEPYQCYSRLV